MLILVNSTSLFQQFNLQLHPASWVVIEHILVLVPCQLLLNVLSKFLDPFLIPCIFHIFPFGECLNKAQPYRGKDQGSLCAVTFPSEPCRHLAPTQTISTTAL